MAKLFIPSPNLLQATFANDHIDITSKLMRLRKDERPANIAPWRVRVNLTLSRR
jgi:hypothetical protein